MLVLWIAAILLGVGLIVWGAEPFAEHLGAAAVRLRVSSFALALLLAGAELEELATAVTASLRDTPAIAFGDVIGANIAIYLVATARNSLNQAAGAMLVAAYAIFIIVLLRSY